MLQSGLIFKQVFQCRSPVPPISHCIRLEALLAHCHIVLVKVTVLLERGLETIFAVSKLHEPFRPDSLGKFQRFQILLSVLPVDFGDKVQGTSLRYSYERCPFR